MGLLTKFKKKCTIALASGLLAVLLMQKLHMLRTAVKYPSMLSLQYDRSLWRAREQEDVSSPQGAGGITVGVYYYPWYGPDFHGRRYLREKLRPKQQPELGEYDDRRPEIIGQHLTWTRRANVKLWVVSWVGPEDTGIAGRNNNTTLGVIMKHTKLEDTKIALFYETKERTNDFRYSGNIMRDILYIAKHYFDHPNYLRIGGRPVLVIYLTRTLARRGVLANFTAVVRKVALHFGHNVYLIGDDDPMMSSKSLQHLDGVTRYNVYGGIGRRTENGYAGQDRVDMYYKAQASWRDEANDFGVGFIPAVTPGFNDRGVRDGNQPLSRKLDSNSEFGSLFRAMLQRAVHLVDNSTGRLLFVNSWNEWHEDTQIEPVKAAEATGGNMSDFLTLGLQYEGYGTRYLDILQALGGEEEDKDYRPATNTFTLPVVVSSPVHPRVLLWTKRMPMLTSNATTIPHHLRHNRAPLPTLTVKDDTMKATTSDNDQTFSYSNGNNNNNNNNNKYNHEAEVDVCPEHEKWHSAAYPTCNKLHEMHLDPSSSTSLLLLGHGSMRSAWRMDQTLVNEPIAIKTLRLDQEFSKETYEAHRRDALALEHLTFSPFVIDVYGYCGQSAINELADNFKDGLGTLENHIRYLKGDDGPRMLLHKLSLALSVAVGVYHIHYGHPGLPWKMDGNNNNQEQRRPNLWRPTMAHSDINPRNIAITARGKPKVNDFNLAAFLRYPAKSNNTENKTCGYPSKFHQPWWRAPEEMDVYPMLNEKVDIYALGNILFRILTVQYPHGEMVKEREDEVRDVVRQGIRPQLMEPWSSGKEPAIQAFRDAMDLCFHFDPQLRGDSAQVATVLHGALDATKQAANADHPSSRSVH